MLLDLHRNRLPALIRGGFDWVDVRDVVASAMAAARRVIRGGRSLCHTSPARNGASPDPSSASTTTATTSSSPVRDTVPSRPPSSPGTTSAM